VAATFYHRAMRDANASLEGSVCAPVVAATFPLRAVPATESSLDGSVCAPLVAAMLSPLAVHDKNAPPVGTLEGGYVRNVPLPRVPRVQSASPMTGTCYSQVPHVPTWSDLTILLAGLGRWILPFSPVRLV
jgi:hypothetical protein